MNCCAVPLCEVVLHIDNHSVAPAGSDPGTGILFGTVSIVEIYTVGHVYAIKVQMRPIDCQIVDSGSSIRFVLFVVGRNVELLAGFLVPQPALSIVWSGARLPFVLGIIWIFALESIMLRVFEMWWRKGDIVRAVNGSMNDRAANMSVLQGALKG